METKVFMASTRRQSIEETTSINNSSREEKSAWIKRKVENSLDRTDFIGVDKEVLKDIMAQDNMKYNSPGILHRI
jgi:hypothetical protein